MHERLTAGIRNHRRTALVDRSERLLDRHPLLQQACGLLNLAAARALEVAGEQRLQLNEQRELVFAAKPLPHQVGPDAQALAQWHAHDGTVFLVCLVSTAAFWSVLLPCLSTAVTSGYSAVRSRPHLAVATLWAARTESTQ